jgi:beta-glucanase (GH16 family)
LTRTDAGDGSCTANQTSSAYNLECSILSNITSRAIIPPVRSARLTTQGTKSIQYGRVEVTAKLPQGDWLWPAIWMMPEDSAYGPWPLSGEIDIMESRGNARGYSGHGRELFMSTLHWGQDLTCYVIFSMILLTSEKVLQFRTMPSGEQHTRAR